MVLLDYPIPTVKKRKKISLLVVLQKVCIYDDKNGKRYNFKKMMACWMKKGFFRFKNTSEIVNALMVIVNSLLKLFIMDFGSV